MYFHNEHEISLTYVCITSSTYRRFQFPQRTTFKYVKSQGSTQRNKFISLLKVNSNCEIVQISTGKEGVTIDRLLTADRENLSLPFSCVGKFQRNTSIKSSIWLCVSTLLAVSTQPKSEHFYNRSWMRIVNVSQERAVFQVVVMYASFTGLLTLLAQAESPICRCLCGGKCLLWCIH